MVIHLQRKCGQGYPTIPINNEKYCSLSQEIIDLEESYRFSRDIILLDKAYMVSPD